MATVTPVILNIYISFKFIFWLMDSESQITESLELWASYLAFGIS